MSLDWLTDLDPSAKTLLEESVSERKLRLFAVAVCRTYPLTTALAVNNLHALDLAERYADDEEGVGTVELWMTQKQFLGENNASTGRGETDTFAIMVAHLLTPGTEWARHFVAEARRLDADGTLETFKEVVSVRHTRRSVCELVDGDTDSWYPCPWLAQDDVRHVAESIYLDKHFTDLPVLADALEEAGCDNREIVEHFRSPGPHFRGCWALDLILGKS